MTASSAKKQPAFYDPIPLWMRAFEQNRTITSSSLVVTYNFLTGEIRRNPDDWYLLEKRDQARQMGRITKTLAEGADSFFCDWGDMPSEAGFKPDECVSVVVNRGNNAYLMERWLRYIGDPKAARRLRRILPHVKYDPLPLKARLLRR